MIWFLGFVLVALVILWVLSPLLDKGKTSHNRRDKELAIYRSQLSEVDTELELGVLDPAEAENVRLEIARRMLKTEKERQETSDYKEASPGLRKGLFAVCAVGLFAVSFYMYSRLGSPDLAVKPAERQAAQNGGQAHDNAQIIEAIARLEARLKENPEHLDNWLLLARTYKARGNYGKTAEAYYKALQLDSENNDIAGEYVEATVLAQGGIVSAEARALLEKLLLVNPEDPRTLYYLSISEAQMGRGEKALEILLHLEEKAAVDAPWLPAVQNSIDRVSEKFGLNVSAIKPNRVKKSTQAPAALSAMSDDQAAQIRSMVEGLATRLKDNPEDIEGWLRLIRSYKVLREENNAVQAVKAARETLSAEEVSRINRLATELNLTP